MSEVKGLPVAGYKATQPPEAIAAVNVFKELEERALRHCELLERCGAGGVVTVDQRFLSIGRTDLQMAFMALNRAIFQPGRVALPEDDASAPELTLAGVRHAMIDFDMPQEVVADQLDDGSVRIRLDGYTKGLEQIAGTWGGLIMGGDWRKKVENFANSARALMADRREMDFGPDASRARSAH